MSNFNFNKVIIGGRMTADAELKTTTTGVLVTSFSVAVNRRQSKNNEADFFDCKAFNKAAELVCKYFRKGSTICVVGSLQKRVWTDRAGEKHYVTEVMVDEVHFVDSKRDSETPLDKAQIEQSAREASAGFNDADFETFGSDETLPF